MDLSESEAVELLALFEADKEKYTFIPVEPTIISKAKHLVGKYGKQGLRTLDSIQLATAISLKNACVLFITTDKLLQSFFMQESLPVI